MFLHIDIYKNAIIQRWPITHYFQQLSLMVVGKPFAVSDIFPHTIASIDNIFSIKKM